MYSYSSAYIVLNINKIFSFYFQKFEVSLVFFIYLIFISIDMYMANMFESFALQHLALAGNYLLVVIRLVVFRNRLSKCCMLNLVAVWQPPPIK